MLNLFFSYFQVKLQLKYSITISKEIYKSVIKVKLLKSELKNLLYYLDLPSSIAPISQFPKYPRPMPSAQNEVSILIKKRRWMLKT